MAYSTQDDVARQMSARELAEITTDTPGAPVDAGIITDAIAKADAEIDVYVGKIITVPVSPAPDILTKLSVDMAIYHLFSRKSVVPENRRQNYTDALALLRLIANGTVQLIRAEAPRTTVEIESSDRVFSRQSQGTW